MRSRIHEPLLRSLCQVACDRLSARAASVALLDEQAEELVFVAAAGEGADAVSGARFKATTGVAGAVLASDTAITVDDLEHDPRFAHDIAVASGYDPDAIAVAPIRNGERVVGVLSVLDPDRDDAAALGLLAGHAAAMLRLAAALGT
jgi:GAF domain-containing protein